MTEQPGEPRTLTLIEDAARVEAHRTHGYRGLVRSSEEHEGWMAGEYRVREKITRSAFRRLMAIRRAYRREAAAAPPEPPRPGRKHYHMEGPWGTQEACWEDHGAEGGTAQPLAVERLAEWFHNKWEGQGISCWHRNQHLSAWDCGRDAIEAAEYARLSPSSGESE